jgi:hypothetical protein
VARFVIFASLTIDHVVLTDANNAGPKLPRPLPTDYFKDIPHGHWLFMSEL